MAGSKRLLSSSRDWRLDRGFIESLVVATGWAVTRRTRSSMASRPPVKSDILLRSMNASPPRLRDAEKSKLVKRLNRIRGQVDALQRALVEQDGSSAKLLQQATACRGAMDSFIAEVIEDHIRERVVQAESRTEATRAAEELIGIVHSYLT